MVNGFNNYPIILPNYLQIKEKIFSYKFDRYHKCLYYLLKIGIFKKCYGDEDWVRNSRSDHLVHGLNIRGISIDVPHDYLYYHTSYKIKIMNLHTNIQKIFYETDKIITKIIVFGNEGFYDYIIDE